MAMKKKLISIMLLCVAIISLMIIPATADSHNIAERCYLDMGREGLKDVACARIQRCSCLPVDNYLAVMLQVQYRVEGSYFWEPSANTYKIEDGYNVDEVSTSIKQDEIPYAKAVYQEDCAYNTNLTFTKTYEEQNAG